MNNATRILIAQPTIETLEDRRLLSAVQLIDGMLIVGGNANGNNRLSVTSDPGGETVFARANDVKQHYLLKDVRQIRVVGGEKNDVITIDAALKKSAFIRAGSGDDSITCGSGSDTVFAGNGRDTVIGGGGDDLIVGGTGPNKIDAGAGDDPNSIWKHKNPKNTTRVVSFWLIDANTGKEVAELKDGAVIDLANLPHRLNVIAKVSTGGETGSVRFDFDGNEVRRIENAPPFALAGDKDGKFASWSPRVGSHTLKATPYTEKNTHGAWGTEKAIVFRVINSGIKNVTSGGSSAGSNGTSNTGGGGSTNTGGGSTNAGGGSTDTGGSNTGGSTTGGSNTGGSDTGGSNSGGGTTTTDASAPAAVIDVMDASVPVGHAIHVNALKSTLKSGDWLGAHVEWDFGDDGSKYNTLVGFNAAHAYTKAGTYTITLKLTNDAGKSKTVTTNVTITAADRRFVYVSPDGNDANNGSSETNAVKTFARASQLIGDNTEVLFERGGTYTVKEGMDLGHKNVVVGSFGSGNKPVLMWSGPQNFSAIFGTLGGENVLIHDVAFDSTYTTLQEEGYNDGVRIGGKNITVRDCSFIDVGYATNSNGSPEGVLVQDNAVTKLTGLRTYFAWVQGSDHVYLGNSVPDSYQSHVLRMAGADRVLIANNDFTNDPTTNGLRGTLTLHKGNYIYVTGNKLTGSFVMLGPLDAGAGLNDKGGRIDWVVVEKNIIKDSVLKISHGTEHTMVRDNVILRDNNIAIDVSGWSSEYNRGVSDLYIVHNTVINNGTTGKFLKVSNEVDGVTLVNNLYVAPNLITGAYQSSPVNIAYGDLSGFRLISDNVWPMPTMDGSAHGGINFVGEYKTAAEWEAYVQVKHDLFQDVTLSSTYTISLDGITAGADLKKAA